MPIIDARYYKTLLICPNRQYFSDLAPLLAHGLPLAPIQEVTAFPSKRQLIDILKGFDAKLCVVDFSPSGNEPAQLLDEIRSVAPSIPVIALLPSNNPDLILRCVRQGATDFLIYPFTTDQIDATMEKVARILPVPTGGGTGGKIVALMPAKGAAGTTTIACNLAYQCKRLGAKTILLGDMDPLAGTVSFLLKMNAGYSFMDVLGRAHTLDADLWKQMITPMQGVDVLLSPETPPDPNVDLPSAALILEYAQCQYQALIIDCGSPFGHWNLSIARLCDELLLVATNELASLQAVQRSMAYFELNRVDTGKVKLIINRYVKDEGLNSEQIGEVAGLEPYQVIPQDNDAVQKSLMEGKPIVSNSAAGKSLASLAERLLQFKDKDKDKETKKTGGLRAMLWR